MSFWKKVCSELEYKGMSRKELAYKTEIPVATINRAIERDSQPYALDAICISNALNVPLKYLLEIPQSKSDGETTDIEENHQIALFKKYHSIIESLEMLSQDKQKEAISIFAHILEFGK